MSGATFIVAGAIFIVAGALCHVYGTLCRVHSTGHSVPLEKYIYLRFSVVKRDIPSIVKLLSEFLLTTLVPTFSKFNILTHCK